MIMGKTADSSSRYRCPSGSEASGTGQGPTVPLLGTHQAGPADTECPACGAMVTPRYTLLSGLEICCLCPDCGLEFNVLKHGRGRAPARSRRP